MITLAKYKSWLATIPAEFDHVPIEAVVFNQPSEVQHVHLYVANDGMHAGFIFIAMGTHLNETLSSKLKVISGITDPQK